MLNIGDYVVRVSYDRDILFRITYISPNQIARLKGVSYRVVADAPISDLELSIGMRYTNEENSIMSIIEDNVSKILKERKERDKGKEPRFQKTGTVLHVDGDSFYLNLCLKYYKMLDIPAIGEHIAESDQPKRIKYLLEKYSPDILVLTGHDALNKNYKTIYDVGEYRNSQYFIDAVKKARTIRPSMSELVIFAGACQSYFEEILAAGADFAASPDRVLIHALDPVFIVEKVAEGAFYKLLPIEETLENTVTRFNGLGGYDVLGKCRRGGPVMPEKVEQEKRRKIEIEEVEGGGLTKEALERELSKPLFKDSKREFENKLRSYIASQSKIDR